MSDPCDFADDDVLPQSGRLQILSPEEYELLWEFPRFSQADRDLFFALKPIRRIRENLIMSEWPNIERILLSLALKTITQSVIVSKLSTYRRQNHTKKALWEFDNIIKSLYLLDYVDSPMLRRNVHKALNRRRATTNDLAYPWTQFFVKPHPPDENARQIPSIKCRWTEDQALKL